jgi:ABC-2 type transport system permease protein
MLEDIRTVMWKERKERAGQQREFRNKLTSLAIPVITFGMIAIYPPLTLGRKWITSPLTLFISVLVPMMVVGMSIADSFAGERERKTLETLYASRLPDRAILLGKMGLPFTNAMIVTFVLHSVSLISVNLANWNGRVIFYSLNIILANLALSVLLSFGIACLGIIVSARARNVQQATQYLMTGMMGPFVLLMFTIILIGTVFPENWRLTFESFFTEVLLEASFSQFMFAITSLLILLDLSLFIFVMYRCTRRKLVLD